MPARAAGLRPSASHAEDAARPWPCAANPAAIAMAKPEVIATQFVPPAAPPLVCANAGTAKIRHSNINKTNIIIFRICSSPYELPPVGGLRRAVEAGALTLNG